MGCAASKPSVREGTDELYAELATVSGPGKFRPNSKNVLLSLEEGPATKAGGIISPPVGKAAHMESTRGKNPSDSFHIRAEGIWLLD